MPNIVVGTLFEGGRIVADSWLVALDHAEFAALTPETDVMVPVALWRANCEALDAHPGRVGLIVGPDDNVFELRGKTSCFDLVAVQFPNFTDGRGYSSARLLRERLGFVGELRAVGDVLPDQIFYLLRCGFNAFAPREAAHIENILRAYTTFHEAYQRSVERPMPLFRRRAEAAALLESV